MYVSPRTGRATRTRPVISIPKMTFLPSEAASASTRAIASAWPIGATLTNPLAMGGERALDRFLAGCLVGERNEGVRVVGLLERTVTEERDARRPRRAVVAFALGLQLS